MTFVKHDAGKPRPSLLPPSALSEVIRALTRGAAKYDPWNWVKVQRWSRYYDAAQRHMVAWQAGESTDPETGLNHLAHAVASLLFLVELETLSLGEDDRPTPDRLRREHREANPEAAEHLEAIVRAASPGASEPSVMAAVKVGINSLGTGEAVFKAVESANGVLHLWDVHRGSGESCSECIRIAEQGPSR